MLRKSKLRNRFAGNILGERMPTMPGSGSAKVPAPPSGYTGWWKATLATVTPTDKFTDAGTTPVTNGGTIYQWSATGSSNHQLQTTALSRPVYSTSDTLNGYAGVQFDGIDDRLQCAGLTPSSPFTLVVVGKFRGADPSGVNGRILAAGQFKSIYDNGTNYGVYETTGSTLDLGVARGTVATLIIPWETNVSHTPRINGVDRTAFAASVLGTFGPVTMGARSNTGSGDEEGYCTIYEALCYPSIISATDLETLETYLRAKFATW